MENSIEKEIYQIPIAYIKSVGKGFNNSFIFLGSQGIGKTHVTLKTLKEENIPFIFSSGVTTPFALYEYLYTHKDDTIVLDDVAGLISNPCSYSLLLAALWSANDERVISWNTSRDIEIPKQFVFSGKLILITNSLPYNSASDVIKSRCLCYKLKLTMKQKLDLMYIIAQTPAENMTAKERELIVDFIKANVDECCNKFDLRVQKKIENLYLSDKENWQKYSMPLFESNEDIEFLVQILREPSLSTTEQISRFIDATGRSRRQFFILKKSLNLEEAQE